MGGVSDLGTSAGWSGSKIGAPNAGWRGRGAVTRVGTGGMRGTAAGTAVRMLGTKPGMFMRGPG